MKNNDDGLFVELSEQFEHIPVEDILFDALFVNGNFHKQWFIEQALLKLGFPLEKEYDELCEDEEYGPWEPGIPD